MIRMAEYEIERVCPVCGKRFEVLYKNQWAYKKARAKGGYNFYCSWKCLRADEMKRKTEPKPVPTKQKKGVNKMSQNKLTREQKGKAVEIAIGGGDPLVYLKECGAKNPAAAWWYIKKTLATKNPQLLEKIPEKIGTVLNESGQVAARVEIAEKLPPEAVAEVPEEDQLEGFEPVNVKEKGTLPAGTTKKEVFEALKVPGMVVLDATGLHTEPPKEAFQFTVTAIRTGLGEFRKDSRDGLVYWVTAGGGKIYLSHREWLKLAEDIPRMLKVLEGEE